MRLDLDSRLRDYGTDIDTAIDTPATGSLAPTPIGSRWVRYAVPAAAAALVAVATGVLIAGGPQPSRPATVVAESTVGAPDERDVSPHGPGDWTTHQSGEFERVTLADDTFSWWVLRDEEFAPDGFTLNTIVSCAGWQADADGVLCSALLDTPLTPSALYGTSARAVDVYTNRGVDPDLDEYARVLAGVAGTVESVDVGDVEGRLLDREGTPRRFVLTWHPLNGPVVALVTTGLDREELLDVARRIEPADRAALAPLPLTLAALQGADDAEIRVGDTLLGSIVNGEACAFSATHLATDVHEPCVALGNDPMVLTMNGQFGDRGFFAGLVAADVHRITVDFADGTSLSIVPLPQPIGDTQAFLASSGVTAPVSITALNSSGMALMTIDLTQAPLSTIPVTEPAETSLPTND